MQYPGDILRVQRISLLLILLFAIALMAVGADAATPVRGSVTTTSPFSNPNALTTATIPPVCQAPCECLSTADAQARWGTGGYTQCSQAPCYQYSTEIGSIKFYCYQQKKVTTAIIGNIPPVTTTLIPVIKNVPAVTTTTPKQLVVPAAMTTDSDGDGKVDAVDNCPDVYNPGQTDSDGDGRGNPCDNCWEEPNFEQQDSDNDCQAYRNTNGFWFYDAGVKASYWINDPKCGDDCDLCPGFDNTADADKDGVADGCDTCHGVDDATAKNTCASCDDKDGDGKAGCIDNCPDIANPDQMDSDNDGIGDSCDYCDLGSFKFLEVIPIQVMDESGYPLVEGKGTVFKAVISSSYSCDKDVNFTITLPEDQWATTGWKSGIFPRQSFPITTGPVTIPANANGYEVYLPYITFNKVDETADPLKDDNIGKMARFPISSSIGPGYQGIAKQIRPDFRIMPAPIKTADGRANFWIKIIPLNEPEKYAPSHTYHSYAEVIATKSWRFLFVHEKFEGVASTPAITDVGEKISMENILATYPIADDAIQGTVMPALGNTSCIKNITYHPCSDDIANFFACQYHTPCENKEDKACPPGPCECKLPDKGANECPYSYDIDAAPGNGAQKSADRYQYLAQTAAKYGYNIGIGVSYLGGQEDPNTKSMTINPDTNYWLFAHEFNHFAVPMGDIPPKEEYMKYCDKWGTTKGFWVNRYTVVENRPYFMDGPSGNNWIIGPSLKELNKFNTTCLQSIYAAHGTGPNPGGIESDGYYNMLKDPDFFLKDPEGLLVSGLIFKNGTAEIQPFSYLPATELNVQPGTRGAYTFVLYDNSGKELSSSGFDLSFNSLQPDNPVYRGVPLENDFGSFVRIIEWKPGTKRIDLKDSTGKVIATRTVSPNPPSVKINTPNGGETWILGKPVTVKWTGSDPDGGTLTYDVGISGDGGRTWVPLAGNLAGNEITLQPFGLYSSDQCRIRIMVTDGVNVGEAISAADFRVVDPNGSPGGTGLSLPFIGGIVLLILIIIASAGWFVLKKKKT